jgi:hypothetical protein
MSMHPTFGSYDQRLLDGRPETAHRFYTLSGVADPLLTRSSKEKSLARWNNYRRGVFHLNISTVTLRVTIMITNSLCDLLPTD